MTDHILLSRATRSPHREKPELPAGAKYDSVKGYWTLNGAPLVHSPSAGRGPVTKKADQETGEDLKGE